MCVLSGSPHSPGRRMSRRQTLRRSCRVMRSMLDCWTVYSSAYWLLCQILKRFYCNYITWDVCVWV